MLNKTVKYLIVILAGVIIFGCITIAVIAGKNSRKTMICSGLEVVVLDSLENDFVRSKDVKKFLEKEYGQYKGICIDSLDLSRIEDIVDGRSAVLKSEAFVTKDGVLHIEVTQRKPIVRFQKAEGIVIAEAEFSLRVWFPVAGKLWICRKHFLTVSWHLDLRNDFYMPLFCVFHQIAHLCLTIIAPICSSRTFAHIFPVSIPPLFPKFFRPPSSKGGQLRK